MSDDKKKTDVNDQLKDFTENERENSKAIREVILFSALGLALILHSGYSVFQMLFDDSIPLVVCPREYDLDKPVIMKTIDQNNETYIQDRWLRGFIRSYTMSLFPRTDADVEPFFTYIKDHSSPEIAYKYQGYLDSADGIKRLVETGQSIKFYPKAGNVRIRPTQSLGTKQTEWVVEVDGFFNKGSKNTSERTLPTIRFTIESTAATKTNPEGLVVTELIFDDSIADKVSSRKKDESTEEKK